MTDTTTLIEGLNKDLAAEYQAIIMYTTYAASVVGPYRKELEAFFAAEIPEEQQHASMLANKIAVLGGTPTTEAEPVTAHDTPRAMLEAVRDAEADTVARYVQRRKEAEEVGDAGLAVALDDLIQDETRHKEECEQMLRGDWG